MARRRWQLRGAIDWINFVRTCRKVVRRCTPLFSGSRNREVRGFLGFNERCCGCVDMICSISLTDHNAIVPGDNFDSFLEDLNDDVSSALAKLQQLEERTTDTLSFEELLVHCEALYKSNENSNSSSMVTHQLKRPRRFMQSLCRVPHLRNLKHLSLTHDTRNTKREAEYSPLFGDLGDLGSLESLGISATSLTALAGEDESGEGSGSVHPLQHKLTFAESPAKEDAKISFRDAEMEDNLKTKYGSHWSSEAETKHPPLSSVPVAKYGSTSGNDERHPGPAVFNKPISEYGNGATSSIPTTTVSKKVSPSNYSQILVKELNGAVTKINELLRQRNMGGQPANQFVLDQDDIQALVSGSKAKACIMLLTKADKLVTQSGVAAYRICA